MRRALKSDSAASFHIGRSVQEWEECCDAGEGAHRINIGALARVRVSRLPLMSTRLPSMGHSNNLKI